MQWVTMSVRMPTEVLGQLEERLQIINQEHSIPVSMNELIIEVLRSFCSTSRGYVDIPNELASNQGPPEYTGEPNMTLHAAIEQVLKDAGHPMRFADIREEVVRRDLYREGNGGPPSHQQVRARVQNYPKVFYIDRSKDPQQVGLLEWDIEIDL